MNEHEDPLVTARGVFHGLLIASCAWAFIVAIILLAHAVA